MITAAKLIIAPLAFVLLAAIWLAFTAHEYVKDRRVK